MIYSLFGIVAGLFLLLCFALPLRYRFLLVLICSVPQLYIIQINGSDVSSALLLSVLLFPEMFKRNNILLNNGVIISLALLILITTVSLLWAINISMGFREIAYLIQFVIILNSAFVLANLDRIFLYRTINVFLFVVCLQSLTIIFFRLDENLKLSLILSPLSDFFLGHNTLNALLTGIRNNFYDPEKSGGVLFINANAAACYAGISSFMAWGVYKANQSYFSLTMAFLLWLSVLFTGSKAGVIFCVMIPLFIFYLKLQKENKIIFSCAVGFFSIVLICSSIIFGVNEQSDFLSQSKDTAGTRYEIWRYAYSVFLENPLIGQGFGGWEINYNQVYDYYLPPHNTLIYLWSKSGMLAVLLAVSFAICCFAVAWRGVKNENKEIKNLGFSVLMIIMWIFFHGFGENFGLIGEQHQMIIFSTMLGVCMAGIACQKRSIRT